MSANDVTRLLIINDDSTEVGRLISMLENAGKTLRPQHAESDSILDKLLQEQNWDLLIAQQQSASVEIAGAITRINKLGKDIPVILQSEDRETTDVVEGLKLGAKDVIRLDDDQHLLLTINRELTNRKQRVELRQLQQINQEFLRRNNQLLDHSKDAIAYIQDGMFTYCNESFAELMGKSLDDIECMPVIDSVVESDQDKVRAFLKEFILRKTEHENEQLSFEVIKESGTTVRITVDVGHAVHDDEPCLQFYSETQQYDAEQLEEEIRKAKDRDPATGLYAQPYVFRHLEEVINSSAQEEILSSLTYLQIDDIQNTVVDTAGLSAVDAVIGKTGELIAKHYPNATFGRFGNTDLVIIEKGIKFSEPESKANTLISDIRSTVFDVGNITLNLTASAGITYISEQSSKADTIIQLATSSAQSQLSEGGNGVKVYEPESSGNGDDNQLLKHSIQNALDNNRFKLLFQPIINLRGEEEELYEVLLRLIDLNGNEVAANDFVQTAIDTKAIGKIDRWVILEAIKVLGKHRGDGHQTNLIINISGQSLCDDQLIPWLKVAFKAANLEPESITFQVQEKDINRHMKAADQFAKSLSSIGSKFAVSNFGRAIDPYKSLKHVECNVVKIDGSFSQDLQDDGQNAEHIKEIIQKLISMNKVTIVPFVESATTLSMLWQTGVHYIQGHYLQAPSESMSYDFNTSG